MQGAYEALKTLTRGKRIGPDDFREFIGSLDLPQAEKQMLMELTPRQYTGRAAQMTMDEIGNG